MGGDEPPGGGRQHGFVHQKPTMIPTSSPEGAQLEDSAMRFCSTFADRWKCILEQQHHENQRLLIIHGYFLGVLLEGFQDSLCGLEGICLNLDRFGTVLVISFVVVGLARGMY